MKMPRLKLLPVAVLSCAFFGCTSTADKAPVVDLSPSLTAEARRDLDRVVREYARVKKGWAEEEYSIKLVRVSSGVVVFSLVHRDDTGSTASVGAGKSIELHIDTAKKVVVQELGYQ
jgi:hypothetical protein